MFETQNTRRMRMLLCPPSLLVHDGNDRRGPESYSPVVPHECELHPPPTEKVARLERVGIAESAASYPNAAGRPVGPRTLEAGFILIDHREQVICVLCDNSQEVAGTEVIQREFLRVKRPVAMSEFFPV